MKTRILEELNTNTAYEISMNKAQAINYLSKRLHCSHEVIEPVYRDWRADYMMKKNNSPNPNYQPYPTLSEKKRRFHVAGHKEILDRVYKKVIELGYKNIPTFLNENNNIDLSENNTHSLGYKYSTTFAIDSEAFYNLNSIKKKYGLKSNIEVLVNILEKFDKNLFEDFLK